MAGYWVRFTADGVPDWFGVAEIEGSEWLDDVTPEMLITQRRVDGKWLDRGPEPELTPEEIAAQAEAEYQAAVEARDAALREALAAEADPVFFKWQRDEATRADWLAKVAEVKARFPMPERQT